MDYKILLKIGAIVCFVLAAFSVGHLLWIPIGLALFVGSTI
jgi:hypothetical protein